MKGPQLNESQRRALNCFVKLMRASNRLTTDAHRHLQGDNLTHSQFAVIEALYHLGPLCQGDLGKKILKSNANLTTVVDSLEKKRLVVRDRTDNDRRRVTVRLTPAGERLIARVFPRHVEIITEEFAVLSAEEQQQLAQLLKKIGRANLGAASIKKG
ncbi:MarR family winged helix-turn-helix transcriptional regulator [Geopsychrobacter electrodiphilus]|uniref:MarR family winged helix-turn-helix transcriptional regulator n=1 Tax=Geopsychrobacter electrodiphilus TaxID=225196 RepID=UPI00036EA30E|nr:MarR family transcriptional regulator [Geopsychrobacter electrodiphilus]